MTSAPRFLLAGGGSGGSATPVIAVAERLRELAPTADLVMVGTSDGPERSLAELAGLRFVGISSGRFRRYWTWQNVFEPCLVLAGLVQSARLIRSYRPSVALGAGGFASAPPLLAASLLGVP